MKYIISFFLIISINSFATQLITLNSSEQLKIKLKYGINSIKRIEHINNEFKNLKNNKNKLLQITKLNKLINKFQYIKDIDHWKKDDYWSSFMELLLTGAGDSEDFAIAKYYLLSKLGFAKEKIFFLKDTTKNKFLNTLDKEHIVLGYKHHKHTDAIILHCHYDTLKISKKDHFIPLVVSKKFLDKKLNTIMHYKVSKYD